MCSLFIPPFSPGPVTQYEHKEKGTRRGREASLSPALPAGGATAQHLTSLHFAFATAQGSPPQNIPQWHIDYFGVKSLKKVPMPEQCADLWSPLKQELQLPCARYPPGPHS